MPEFFSFTLGAETNSRVLRGPDEESPLLVGRFRAVVQSDSGRAGRGAGRGRAGRRAGRAGRAGQAGESSRDGGNPHQPHARRHPRWPSRWSQRWPLAGGQIGQISQYERGRPYGAVSTSWGSWEAAEQEDDEDDGYDEEDEDDEEGADSIEVDDDTWTLPGGKDARRPPRQRRRVLQRCGRHVRDVWLTPRPAAVRRVMGRWWTRWALLVVLPAVVAVTWCAVPMPQWALADGENGGLGRNGEPKRPPGHGEARVRIGFWHFLLAYYGPYNGVALVWITKVFNLYGLNWWADSLGFVASAVLLAAASLAAPALFFVAAPQTARRLLSHNTVWVTWTFAVMAVPAAAALALLLLHERHLGLRHALSATQRIFTTARWAGEPDGQSPQLRASRQSQKQNQNQNQNQKQKQTQKQKQKQKQPHQQGPDREQEARLIKTNQDRQADLVNSCVLPPSSGSSQFSPADSPRSGSPTKSAIIATSVRATSSSASSSSSPLPPLSPSNFSSLAPLLPLRPAVAMRRSWLPASFVRFLWLVSALFISLLVFELGEASASLFLSALPAMRHETVYAVVYVWGWTVTVFLLDLLTAWILGGHQGERVGSYPLGWVFKLYFMLTYQTYVRALYARLRSPSQVIMLQVLSSSTLIVLTPVLMSPWTHRLLVALGLNGLAYGAYQKVCARNVFVRFVAENATMLAFLGALLVLHFGPNRDVYPYFGFDDEPVNATANALGSLLDRFASQTYGYTPSLPDYPVPPPPAYTFSFTLYAATITWACELVAAVLVSSLILCFYGIAVVAEAKADLAAWPELLPASVAVTVHVLQNMLFSIIRLRF